MAGDRVRVEQKWGFGMAPVKPDVQHRREEQVRRVLDLLEEGEGSGVVADALAEVKGLFNRCHRQDQWDWFTVWTQLGRPGRRAAREVANRIATLRRAQLNGEAEVAAEICGDLAEGRASNYLHTFLRGGHRTTDGIGYVYVLSTREQPRILKVGYTDRPVEDRVREINQVTGLAIPFGVRAVWAVRDAARVESQIHAALAEYRVREDREFFDVDFHEAFEIIGEVVAASRREV